MREKFECPNCDRGSAVYDYYATELATDGQAISPATGFCRACGFYWEEHVNHPIEEQVKRFQEKQRSKT